MSIRILVLLVLWVSIITAQEIEINITFSDLPELVKNSSPQSKILQAEYDAFEAENEIELQWSNPELEYGIEQVEFAGQQETEQTVVLSKSFDFPWNYFKQKNIQQTSVQMAEYNLNQSKNNLLAEIKTGYVHLSLMRNISNQMHEHSASIIQLYQALKAQKEEGAVSKLDAKLLSLSIFDFESEVLELEQEFRIGINNWATFLGFDVNQKIIFTDSINYINVALNDVDKENLIQKHLGFQARQKRMEVLNQRLSLEKWLFIPSFSLHGGYKKANPQWEGFVLGLSLPLPIFNQNGPQIEKQKSEFSIYKNETIMYKQNLQSQISNLIAVIRDKSELFNKHQLNEINIKNMVAAYREGIWSLPDLLNAIQMVSENKIKYIEQLTSYYQAVFELEAISGQQLVTF